VIGLDDIGLVGTGVSLVQQVYALGKFLKGVADTNVIAAHFDWDGTKITGDESLRVEQHHMNDEKSIWLFSVDDKPDYTFVRAPVIESAAIELIGTIEGENNPDAKIWRWIAPRTPGVIYGGQHEPVNLKVEFIIVGYRSAALIKNLAAGA
jgi:hypothetical protein